MGGGRILSIRQAQTLNLDTPTAYCSQVQVGAGSLIWNYVHLDGCRIGAACMIGTFVQIEAGATIGDRCRVQSHTRICLQAALGADCFIGHGVVFLAAAELPSAATYSLPAARVGRAVSMGSNVTLYPVQIGNGSVIGAGSVVTEDIPPDVVVAGNPARVMRRLDQDD